MSSSLSSVVTLTSSFGDRVSSPGSWVQSSTLLRFFLSLEFWDLRSSTIVVGLGSAVDLDCDLLLGLAMLGLSLLFTRLVSALFLLLLPPHLHSFTRHRDRVLSGVRGSCDRDLVSHIRDELPVPLHNPGKRRRKIFDIDD